MVVVELESNMEDKKKFSDWLRDFDSKSSEDISKWVDEAKKVCLEHFTYNKRKGRSKDSIYFKLALIASIKLKLKKITLKKMAIELTRTLNRGKVLHHSAIINYYRILEKTEDPKNGYKEFTDKYIDYIEHLKEKGLL